MEIGSLGGVTAFRSLYLLGWKPGVDSEAPVRMASTFGIKTVRKLHKEIVEKSYGVDGRN